MNSITRLGLVFLVGGGCGMASMYLLQAEHATEQSTTRTATPAGLALTSDSVGTQHVENLPVERATLGSARKSSNGDSTNASALEPAPARNPQETPAKFSPTAEQLQTYELVKSRLVEPGMRLDRIMSLPETQALPKELKDKVLGEAIGMLNRQELDPASFLPGYSKSP